ncbi:MAG TPA: sigma-70 family RNA polymerase sigma factor [Tahibacter sp.]|nr:sigma-70 family RNA polymerase sigma factor [Tahibacter sp.]
MDVSAQQGTTGVSDEDEWLRRVALGDRAAFERLYRATSSRLLGVCLRILPDRAEAEDVLQEAYVAAWRKAPQFDPERSKAITWLAAIARHRAIDRLRATPALAVQAPIDLVQTQADPSPAPSTLAEADDERARLDDCLRQLEPKRRQLIHTAFFDGATYEELAGRCGSPLGSVKSWIRRGLMQLRACLES